MKTKPKHPVCPSATLEQNQILSIAGEYLLNYGYTKVKMWNVCNLIVCIGQHPFCVCGECFFFFLQKTFPKEEKKNRLLITVDNSWKNEKKKKDNNNFLWKTMDTLRQRGTAQWKLVYFIREYISKDDLNPFGRQTTFPPFSHIDGSIESMMKVTNNVLQSFRSIEYHHFHIWVV